jgi:energy-converting hydrogenase Eha subunit F
MIRTMIALYPELYCLSLAMLILLGLVIWHKRHHQLTNGQ